MWRKTLEPVLNKKPFWIPIPNQQYVQTPDEFWKGRNVVLGNWTSASFILAQLWLFIHHLIGGNTLRCYLRAFWRTSHSVECILSFCSAVSRPKRQPTIRLLHRPSCCKIKFFIFMSFTLVLLTGPNGT